MKINETFVRTSKNYGLNNLEIEENVFNNKIKNFPGFTTNFEGKIKENKILPISPISEETKTELEKANISLEFDVEKSYPNPIILDFDFGTNECLVDKIKINIKENICAKILMNYQSFKKCHHNGFISISCEKNSNTSCVLISDLSKQSDNFLNYENNVEENANLDFTIIDFSGNYSVHRYISNSEKENAKSFLKAMYISDNKSKIDLNFAQNVYGKNSNVSIETVGALQGKSVKNFKGMIDFKSGSCRSKGEENELCLLLSKDAKSKAMPLLCCSEEDVEGSHSSATGKIGENELFYIMSRGLSKTEGLKLLLKAKLNNILNGLFDEKIKNEINEKIDRKILNG